MIRTNPLAVTLITGLLLLGLFVLWSVTWWYLGVRELQGLKYQYQAMSRSTSAMQALAGEALEYSRRTPAIDPILQEFELKARPAPSPSGKSAANPPASPPRPAP